MSVPVLFELQEEVNRIAAAGSELAEGDMKLNKLVPHLFMLGEKSPVFKRLGEMTKALSADRENAAGNLLDLSQLLSSVLYTLGTAGKEGELEPHSGSSEIPSELPHSVLRPLIEALTTKGSGRMEVIEHAHQTGKTYDLRLLVPLIEALNDSYQEIGDFVADKVLPQYGQAVLPFLSARFSVKGKKADSRILKVIHHIRGKEGLSFFIECLENGSAPVKNASIEILANYGEAEELLLEYSRAKKADIRRSALEALGKRDSDRAIERIVEALDSNDMEIALEIARTSGNPSLVDALVSFAERIQKEYLQTKSRDKGELLQSVIWCFDRTENIEVLRFLRGMACNHEIPAHIARGAVTILLGKEDFESQSFVESVVAMPKRQGLADLSLYASLKIRTKEEVYEKYSRYAKRGRQDPAGKAILELMDRCVFFRPELREFDEDYQRHYYRYYDESYNSEELSKCEWDIRWVGLLMSLDEEKLVYRLSHRVYEENHVSYLIEKLRINPYFSSKRGMGAMTALVQMEYDLAFDILVDTLKKTDQNMKSVKFHVSSILTNIGLFLHLPGKYGDKLREVAETEIEHPDLKDRILEISYDMISREGK